MLKASQPSLPGAITARLAGTDVEFAGVTRTDQGKGHSGPSLRTRTGNQPNDHAVSRNLVTSAFRKKRHANIAAARRYYDRDDQCVLASTGTPENRHQARNFA